DLWPADFIERCCLALSYDSQAVAASCDRMLNFIDQRTHQYNDLQPLVDNATQWLLLNDAGIGSATMFRTQQIANLGGYNEQIPTGHDTELFLRLSLCGRWLHVPGQPVVFQRGSSRRRGEAGNLSENYTDHNRRWAQILDDFIVENCNS